MGRNSCTLRALRCSGVWRQTAAKGHAQPRKPKARATGVHPITDTKAIKLRDRSGPLADIMAGSVLSLMALPISARLVSRCGTRLTDAVQKH